VQYRQTTILKEVFKQNLGYFEKNLVRFSFFFFAFNLFFFNINGKKKKKHSNLLWDNNKILRFKKNNKIRKEN
jgi:hypothetical protein